MQYNLKRYNAGEYNITAFSVNLSDSMTESDTLTKRVTTFRTDSQGTADTIADRDNMAALLETVTIYQHAYTPFGYNNGRYNDFMYNRRVDQDEVLLMPIKALADSFTLSDALGGFLPNKALAESITEATVIFFLTNPLMQDFLFLDTAIRVEISNKAISDVIRINDWLLIRKIEAGEWYN